MTTEAINVSLDHLVRPIQHALQNRQTDLFRRLEINHQLELGRLLVSIPAPCLLRFVVQVLFSCPIAGNKDCTTVAAAPVIPADYVFNASRIADSGIVLVGYRLADLMWWHR